MTWSTLSFTDKSLKLQIEFAKPSEMSSIKGEPNRLLVKVWDASLFVRERDGIKIERHTTLSVAIPK